MASPAPALRREWEAPLGRAGWLALCAGAGVAIGLGHWLPVLAVVVAAMAFAVGLVRWRWSLYLLLAYIPVSGLAGLALHPDTGLGVALRDGLFVAPLYAGFFAGAAAARRPVLFRGAPVAALALLVVLVLAQALNPSIPEASVSLIGTKVWLSYIPLLFVGYHALRDKRDLSRILAIMSIAAVVPVAVGIVVAILLYAGYTDFVYGLYGPAAKEATQGFAELHIGEAVLRRVPSTFTSGAQYYAFTISMIAITYAWWQGAESRVSPRLRGLLVLLVFVACFLSGTRGAFLFAPFLVVLIVLLHRGALGRVIQVAAASAVALAAVVTVTGIGAQALLGNALQRAFFNLDLSLIQGFTKTFEVAPFGLGTGTDTRAVRYQIPDAELFALFGGAWQESWWVKAAIELGALGLILVLILFGTLLVRAWRIHWSLRDPQLRAVSAALLALFIWMMVYGVKAQYVDFDPMNMFLWLTLGMLLKLPALDRR